MSIELSKKIGFIFGFLTIACAAVPSPLALAGGGGLPFNKQAYEKKVASMRKIPLSDVELNPYYIKFSHPEAPQITLVYDLRDIFYMSPKELIDQTEVARKEAAEAREELDARAREAGEQEEERERNKAKKAGKLYVSIPLQTQDLKVSMGTFHSEGRHGSGSGRTEDSKSSAEGVNTIEQMLEDRTLWANLKAGLRKSRNTLFELPTESINTYSTYSRCGTARENVVQQRLENPDLAVGVLDTTHRVGSSGDVASMLSESKGTLEVTLNEEKMSLLDSEGEAGYGGTSTSIKRQGRDLGSRLAEEHLLREMGKLGMQPDAWVRNHRYKKIKEHRPFFLDSLPGLDLKEVRLDEPYSLSVLDTASGNGELQSTYVVMHIFSSREGDPNQFLFYVVYSSATNKFGVGFKPLKSKAQHTFLGFQTDLSLALAAVANYAKVSSSLQPASFDN